MPKSFLESLPWGGPYPVLAPPRESQAGLTPNPGFPEPIAGAPVLKGGGPGPHGNLYKIP